MNRYLLAVAALALVATAIPAPAALALPPANDDFDSAELLTGPWGNVEGTNYGATTEAGEPTHLGGATGASVWYRWIAPLDGTAMFTAEAFRKTVGLAVYTGPSVEALTPIVRNWDYVIVRAKAGTEYMIALDTRTVFTTAIGLHWWVAQPPPNDDFVNAAHIEGRVGYVRTSTHGASDEPGEPVHAAGAGGSIWYGWRAAATESVRFDAFDSVFTRLAVYTGETVDALTRLASSDDTDAPRHGVSFRAEEGRLYWIAVVGFGGYWEDVWLEWYPGAIVVGTPGDDVLRGTPGPDYMSGRAGDDLVLGGGGADLIHGGKGDDRLYGGAGRDRFWDRAGADRIFAGADNDFVNAGPGPDRVHADGGHDVVWGGYGDDLLFGEGGRDDLDGSKGADRLVGGPGADWLWSEDGRGGNDAVYGGRGIDAAFADRGDLVHGVP